MQKSWFGSRRRTKVRQRAKTRLKTHIKMKFEMFTLKISTQNPLSLSFFVSKSGFLSFICVFLFCAKCGSHLLLVYLILTKRSSPVAKDAQSASMSSTVLYSERLILNEQSASFGVSPKAISEPLGALECEEQADPLETYIPRDER